MAHHYFDPFVGSGVQGDPQRAAHADDHDTDPAKYRHHPVARDGVYVASAVEIEVYEELADDSDSEVYRYDADDGEYPAPEVEEDDEHVCEDCGDSFDSAQGLASHKRYCDEA